MGKILFTLCKGILRLRLCSVRKNYWGGYSSLKEEKADLSKLKAKYEQIIDEKYKPYFVKTIDECARLKGDAQFKTLYDSFLSAYRERSESICKELSETNLNRKELTYESLRREIDLKSYLHTLNLIKSEVLVVFAVKDTPGNTITDDELNSIKKFGFTKFSKSFRVMYIGTCYKNEIKCDISGEKSLLPVTYEAHIDGINVKASSMAWSNGNKAEIFINDIDYSVNMRGINIVVYDIKNGNLVDSVAFDYFTNNRTVKHLSNKAVKTNI